MGQSLKTLFTMTLCPSEFVTKISYSISFFGKLPKLGMEVQTYEWVHTGSIKACTIVSKIWKLPTITSGAFLSSTAFISYDLVGAWASCLPMGCVTVLGAFDDATLLLSLLPFYIAEAIPLVWSAVKERALGQSFTLCSLNPQTKQAPISLQQSPLCLLPQCIQ